MKIILISFIFILIINASAFAQSQCDTRPDLLSYLKTKYNEEIVSMAVTNTGTLVERLESNNKETWSLIITFPVTQQSCLIAAGTGWKELKVKEGEQL